MNYKNISSSNGITLLLYIYNLSKLTSCLTILTTNV